MNWKITRVVAALAALILLVACTQSSTVAIPTVVAVVNTGATEENAPSASVFTDTMTVVAALAANQSTHEDGLDYQWESAAVIPITLQGNTIAVDQAQAMVDGSTATITAAGVYSISGVLENGQIAVDTTDEETVWLLLNGVTIHNATNAAINVVNAEKVVIVLADGTVNTLSDGASYVFADPATDEPNAALFSKADLTITGNGALRVTANYNDGIASKDGLLIANGSISVDAIDDGIRGKDYLVVKAGDLTVNAGGDGFKADDTEDDDRGYIAVEAGRINITASGDAIAAETDVLITGGEFTLVTNGGSTGAPTTDTSAKGIKAAANLIVEGGIFAINTADDGLHSNESLTITDGAFTIASGDDAIHADALVVINGGAIQITQSYEGIESAVITINGGTIHLVATDDGVNVAGDSADAEQIRGPRGPSRDQAVTTYTGDEYLYMNGGYLVVQTNGDGVDVNGAVEMTGGVIIVNGPTMRMNSALDYDALFNMTGGTVVAVGSARMAQAPGDLSTQNAVLINFDAIQPASTLVHLQSSEGAPVLTFAPTKEYQSLAFSSAALVTGATYELYLGGTATGTVTDGLYQNGSYTPGTPYTSFTIADTVTRIGVSRR